MFAVQQRHRRGWESKNVILCVVLFSSNISVFYSCWQKLPLYLTPWPQPCLERNTLPLQWDLVRTHTCFAHSQCHTHTYTHVYLRSNSWCHWAPRGPLYFEVCWLQESHRKLCLTENKLSQLEDVSLPPCFSLSLSFCLSFSLSLFFSQGIWFHSFRSMTVRPVAVVEQKWGCSFNKTLSQTEKTVFRSFLFYLIFFLFICHASSSSSPPSLARSIVSFLSFLLPFFNKKYSLCLILPIPSCVAQRLCS